MPGGDQPGMAGGQEGASACRHAGQTRVRRGAGTHTAVGTAAAGRPG
jgi:hypothetical protein